MKANDMMYICHRMKEEARRKREKERARIANDITGEKRHRGKNAKHSKVREGCYLLECVDDSKQQKFTNSALKKNQAFI
jgi:hypothetical protein